MIKNTTFIGTCRNCDRPCVQQSEEFYIKNHKDGHKVYTQSEVEKKIQTHLLETTGKAYERKLIILKQYFSELRERMADIEKRKIRQLYRLSIQQSFNVEKNIGNAKKLESLGRYAYSIIEGKGGQLTCDNTDFLLRSLDRVDKCMENGWRPDFSVLNQCINQTDLEISKSIQNLRKELVTKTEALDVILQKQILQKGKNKRESTRRGDRNQRSGQKQIVKITLVKDATQEKQFAIKVKVTKIITFFKQKKYDMVVFIGRDSSGTSMVTYKKHDFIQAGNTVRIDKCQVQDHNGKKQIGGLVEAEITLVSEQKEKQKQIQRGREREKQRQRQRQRQRQKKAKENEKQKEKLTQRQRQRQRQRLVAKQKQISERDWLNQRKQKQELLQQTEVRKKRNQQQTKRERRPPNREPKQIPQKRQYKKEETMKKGRIHQEIEQQDYTKVKQICPDSQNLTLCVKILEIKVQTVSGLICVVGDDSGIVNAQLPPKQQCVKEGGTILITNGQAEVRDEHVILVIGKNGRVKRSLKSFPIIGLANNISAECWVEGE